MARFCNIHREILTKIKDGHTLKKMALICPGFDPGYVLYKATKRGGYGFSEIPTSCVNLLVDRDFIKSDENDIFSITPKGIKKICPPLKQ